jgi:hydroxypyruvate isomerase
MPNRTTSRRDLLLTATGLTAAALLPTSTTTAADGNVQVAKSGHINHSVCLWCYKGMKSADMAPVAKRLGLKAIDLLKPEDWAPLKDNGLICSMTSGVWGGIEKGLNRK